MDSSRTDPTRGQLDAVREVSRLLDGASARLIREALTDGVSLSSALGPVEPQLRRKVGRVIRDGGLAARQDLLQAGLAATEGAQDLAPSVDLIWTMPGHSAKGGPLTAFMIDLVGTAETSVVCSTFNFQKTSGMWTALAAAAGRPGVAMRVYVDREATDGRSGPSAEQIARQIAPGTVLCTKSVDERQVRNHAKFLSVDHRTVVVTSANFSWSAENNNIELGLRLVDSGIARSIESQLQSAEQELYSVVELT